MGGADKRPNDRHTIPIYIDVFDDKQSISLSALWNEANEAIVILRDTGAGDAFVGGFLASLDQNVEAGHFAARFIIQQSGCQLVKPCTFNFDVGKRALLLKD